MVDLQACVLCGGSSRRMGRDKALIAHPRGGCWLTRSVDLCQQQGLSVHVVSPHLSHHKLVSTIEGVIARSEPLRGRGPLAALASVFGVSNAKALLVMPVDMPWLESETLVQLIQMWSEHPSMALVSHDGSRHQPLFAVYPNESVYRATMSSQLISNELSMFSWLCKVPYQTLVFPEARLRNVNYPEDWEQLEE